MTLSPSRTYKVARNCIQVTTRHSNIRQSRAEDFTWKERPAHGFIGAVKNSVCRADASTWIAGLLRLVAGSPYSMHREAQFAAI